MNLLPSGFPGSFSHGLLCLPCWLDSQSAWNQDSSPQWNCCPLPLVSEDQSHGFLCLDPVGKESWFFVKMKWLPSGFPGSVPWEFSPVLWRWPHSLFGRICKATPCVGGAFFWIENSKHQLFNCCEVREIFLTILCAYDLEKKLGRGGCVIQTWKVMLWGEFLLSEDN